MHSELTIRRGRRWVGIVIATCALALPGLAPSGVRAQDRIEYNRDIRPILFENCFACHGPDSASRKGGLRLDQRDAALEARAFVPGKPAESELLRRITSTDADDLMPPPATRKVLTDRDKELLRRWIESGAEYQLHWAFLPPRLPELPGVKDVAWARNPIDRFVLARLEAQGLSPAPEADRRTLARRLSLDLTGLPPEPADVDAFVNDSTDGAYERFVDKLLESAHWGEHRGRYWLDVSRYADTHGIHFDNFREMWSYRDWVIKAFNQNLPFDRFTLDQLAGDLMEKPTLDQQVASGFNRCNMTTNEGGAISEEYLVLYTRDRTDTTSQVWLGLTAGCAVCHSHKFDPLSHKEFYEMAAFFNNTTQNAMDGNIKDTPPIVPVPLEEDRGRWESLQGELLAARRELEERRVAARGDFDAWLAKSDGGSLAKALPTNGLRAQAPLNEGDGNKVAFVLDAMPREVAMTGGNLWEAGHVSAQALKCSKDTVLEAAEVGDFEKDQPFAVAAWIRTPRNEQSGSVVARMKDQGGFRGWDIYFVRGRLGMHLVHDWDQDAIKVLSKNKVKEGQWNHIAVTYDGSSKASGLRVYFNGSPEEISAPTDRLKSSIRTNVAFRVGARETGTRLDDLTIQDLRIYDRVLSAEEANLIARISRIAWLVAKPAANRQPEEADEIFRWWLSSLDSEFMGLEAKRLAFESEEGAIRARGTQAHIMNERKEMPAAFVLNRGEYDQRRDQVNASTPAVLPPYPSDYPRNRLGFAKWLLLPAHPLTARVTVNRFWQEVFGSGIVRTAGDFGVAGEVPSHPDLLDWLAVTFRDDLHWDVKRFFKLMVTSATYRQAAAATPQKTEQDPQNRWLSRGPRFRMDAEMIRDNVLAASGLLVRKIGGPSVKPYQPEGVWEAVAMMESNTRYYKQDVGEKLYRRSLYTFWKRAAPPASMDVFNAPNRELCTVRRERTNTPLQALVTLNDVQHVEAARFLAERALKEGGADDEAKLDFIARRILLRSLRPEEAEVVQASFNEHLQYYRAHVDDARALIAVGESRADPAHDPAKLAAWTMVSNELFNLDEVLNK